MARAAVVAAALAAAFLVLPGAARANGDPCSDQLTISDLCIPSGLNLPPSATKDLAAVLTQASKNGAQVKVAVIANQGDLGLIPQLFGKPQLYARFLGQEILYTYDGLLLVVMKQGYGVFDGRKPVTREVAALRTLKPPASGKVIDLIRASAAPAKRLADLGGKSDGKKSSGSPALLIIGIGAFVLIALGAAGLQIARSRRKRA